MSIDRVKLIIAVAIALLTGFICEIIAPTAGGRNWISLVIGAVSISAVLVPAMGLKYTNERRGLSIKVFAWMMSLILALVNIVISCFEYKVDIYIAVTILLSIIGWGVIYSMLSAK